MAASVEFAGASVPVKLRNLSKDGALVEAVTLPPVGTPVRFSKGELALSGHVAWEAGKRAGIAFDCPLDPEMVLRHVPQPNPRPSQEYRRPGLRGQQLSPGERKLGEDWIFGIPLPRLGD